MSREFKYELKIDATPEAVWKALTTVEGIQSWFAPDVRVTPGENGTIWISFGPGMEGESRIGAWEPASHFAYIQDRPSGDPSVVDFVIEGQGGSTTLRLVQSGFGEGAAFDSEYESTSRAWPLFMHMLKHSAETPHSVVRNITVLRYSKQAQQELFQAIDGLAPKAKVTYEDSRGYRCLEYPDLNNSITAIFCEACGGQAAVTLMTVLYDPAPGVEDRLRSEWTAIADAVAPVATATA